MDKDPYMASSNQTVSGSGPKSTELTDEFGEPIEPDGIVQIWNKKQADAIPTNVVFKDTVLDITDFISGRITVMEYYNIHFNIAPKSKFNATYTSKCIANPLLF